MRAAQASYRRIGNGPVPEVHVKTYHPEALRSSTGVRVSNRQHHEGHAREWEGWAAIGSSVIVRQRDVAQQFGAVELCW